LGNDTQKENTAWIASAAVMTGYSFVDGSNTPLSPTGSMFMIQHDAAGQAIIAQAWTTPEQC